MWKHPGAHLTIGSLDSQVVVQVVAQYNPKQVAVQKQVAWVQQCDDVGKDWGGGVRDFEADGRLALHYGANQPRSLRVELLFDALEDGDASREWVRDQIAILEELASPIEPGSLDQSLRRAHICVLVWGAGQPKFVCVIESLDTTYTMFDKNGYPLRATCTVALKEVNLRDMYALERIQNRVNADANAHHQQARARRDLAADAE